MLGLLLCVKYQVACRGKKEAVYRVDLEMASGNQQGH